VIKSSRELTRWNWISAVRNPPAQASCFSSLNLNRNSRHNQLSLPTTSYHINHHTMTTAVWPPLPAEQLKQKEDESLVHMVPLPKPEYATFRKAS
jgi:hypothetical protein